MKNGQPNILQKQIQCSLAPGQPPSMITIGALLNLAKQNLNKDSLPAAEHFCKQLNKEAPNFLDPFIVLAVAQLNQGNFTSTIATIESLLSRGAQNPEVLLIASIAYRENNQLDKALQTIQKATGLYPKNLRIKRESDACRKLENPVDTDIKVAIASTVRGVEKTIESFVRYHLAIGIDRIFLFFDNPGDPAISKVENIPEVDVIKYDDHLRAQWMQLPTYSGMKSNIEKEVMTRQLLNLQVATQHCLEKGIDWLLHIDSDELFFCEDVSVKEHFQSLSHRDLDVISYLNYEAIPSNVDTVDFFKEATVFKRNQTQLGQLSHFQKKTLAGMTQFSKQFFLFYFNGKSAGRISKMLLPKGVHEFASPDPIRFANVVNADAPAILHYPCCGFEHFWNKYLTLGNFSDKWFGTHDIKASIGEFHTDSRDIVALNDIKKARDYYIERVVVEDEAALNQLEKAGLIRRIDFPVRVLSDNHGV